MSKHTPGPWFVNLAGSERNWQFVYDECYVYAPGSGVDDVAVAATIADPLTGKPSEADARLISAAPELLEALEDADEWICGLLSEQSTGGERLQAIRAAITKAKAKAKAKGESQ